METTYGRLELEEELSSTPVVKRSRIWTHLNLEHDTIDSVLPEESRPARGKG